jgi:phosphatidylglycerophosphate synthase
MLDFTILYMLRDTWVTFLRAVGAAGGADVSAMWLGKVRTALSFPGAGWVYAYLALRRYFPEGWSYSWLITCYVAEGFLAALTIWSLFSYTRAYAPHLRKALARE